MSGTTAVITGITGQDGSYLAERVLSAGGRVVGLVRGSGRPRPERLARISHLLEHVRLEPVELHDDVSLRAVLAAIKPTECYHLAAQTSVPAASEDERATLEANILGTHHLLAALRGAAPGCRFLYAASSEIFGHVRVAPQAETTPPRPRSIYGITKLAGFELTRFYREQYGLHASSAIFYNHESPRRGPEFVTRKITLGVARILARQATELRLGNLDARRDWGHAREYADAMWRMLRQEIPDDYVVATGRLHSVGEFVRLAFAHVGLDWTRYVVVDPAYVRPEGPTPLVGDPRKAATQLGWRAEVSLATLVAEMVESDCRDLGVAVRTA